MATLTRNLRKAGILFHRNPRLLLRKAEIRIRRHFQGPVPTQGTLRIGTVQFPFDANLDPGMKRLSFHEYEPEVRLLLEKFLHPGSAFIDVGANLGYFSAIALHEVGKNGQVHAFEPVPWLYSRLKELARLNPRHSLRCNEFALGDREEIRRICISGPRNIGWNTLVPGFMPASDVGGCAKVAVQRLDTYLLEEKVRDIGLIKIDVEGFEFRVLHGAQSFFNQTKQRPPIVCEVAPQSYPLLGCCLADLKTFMSGLGYACYDTVELRAVDLCSVSSTTNVLFLSDDKFRNGLQRVGVI